MNQIKKKIILLGDGAVGKTSLIRRYVIDEFSDDYIQTIGVKVSKKEVEIIRDDKETKMTMMIWDLIGQKGYRYTQSISLTDMDGALLVCDLTRKETLTSLLSYWIPLILRTTGPIPMIFLGNKSDLEDKQEFDVQDINDIAYSCESFGSTMHTNLTSAKTGLNVELTFSQMAEIVKDFKKVPKMDAHWRVMDPSEINTLTDVVDHIIADFADQFGGIEHATPFIKHQMTLADLHPNDPSELSITKYIDNLAAIETGYKTEVIVRENKDKRMKLFQNFVK